ncbi:MAG TPA: pseudouridine synthase [Mariprofundaceae bacterium]|nr:pseudouridine synthase [Mariprofundaceae bacterium]
MSHTTERVDRLLSRLGYGSRRDVRQWIKQGRITCEGEALRSPSTHVGPDTMRFDGEPLDHPDGITLIYHKPVGATCSHKEHGRLIYDDFPERWQQRNPPLTSIGRLDKDTSGLLILTDDGQLNHTISSPKHHIPKTYQVTLASPLRGDETESFAAGTLLLDSETTPCLPAKLHPLSAKEAELTIHEGRYHQVRRMFVAVGNHVSALHRSHIGRLGLDDLPPGHYRLMTPHELLKAI